MRKFLTNLDIANDKGNCSLLNLIDVHQRPGADSSKVSRALTHVTVYTHHLVSIKRQGVHLMLRNTLLHGNPKFNKVAWEYSNGGLVGFAITGVDIKLSGCCADKPSVLCRASDRRRAVNQHHHVEVQ